MGQVCPACFILLVALLLLKIMASIIKDMKGTVTGCKQHDGIPCVLCKKCMKPGYWSSEVYHMTDEKEVPNE